MAAFVLRGQRVEELEQRLYGSQSLKCLLPVPLYEKMAFFFFLIPDLWDQMP